jgi:hypothetical protein
VSHRPLALVSGLTVGDYLLWNWSLNGNHDVLALVSGLTLPPLAVACLWLFALSLARLIARSARRSRVQAGARRRHADRDREHRAGRSTATPAPSDPAPASAAPTASAPSSGKLAA